VAVEALGRGTVRRSLWLGIHWLHDKSEEAVRAAAGCTASYEFDTPLALSAFCLDGEWHATARATPASRPHRR